MVCRTPHRGTLVREYAGLVSLALLGRPPDEIRKRGELVKLVGTLLVCGLIEIRPVNYSVVGCDILSDDSRPATSNSVRIPQPHR